MSTKLTGGTDEAPRGLRVASEELQKWLLRLEPDEAKFFVDLMGRTQKEGFIEFAELGHGKNLTGRVPLPEAWVAMLDAGKIKVADLSDPLLGLGDVSQYDLSKWSK